MIAKKVDLDLGFDEGDSRDVDQILKVFEEGLLHIRKPRKKTKEIFNYFKEVKRIFYPIKKESKNKKNVRKNIQPGQCPNCGKYTVFWNCMCSDPNPLGF